MENIKASSLKTQPQIVGDLKELLVLINDGKEGYQHAAEATDTPELKALFSKLSGERMVDAAELEEHIAAHGGDVDNDNGGILGNLHRSWLTLKQTFSSKEDKAILQGITTGEMAAIEKYNQCIADYADHADHLELLKEQREGIQDALTQIEKEIVKLG